MVIMVQRSVRDGDVLLALAAFRARDERFAGPRSFLRWELAAAYALLPVDPDLTPSYPLRREVFRAPDTGRWVARGTRRLAPARAAAAARVSRLAPPRPPA